MRLLPCLLSLSSLAAAVQVVLIDDQEARTSTLIDVLSADPDYTSLLSLLQRALLVPTLNKLNGSTLFAPTNDAIGRSSLWNEALADDAFFEHDNRHEELRQALFYHLLDYTLPDEPWSEDTPQVHKTLHFPRKPKEPPTHEPPPSPPWMPIPGGTLAGQPQRLRLASREGAGWVGVDAFAKEGAKVVKDRVNASNGVVFGINEVLEVPPDLATVVTRHPALTYLSSIMEPTALAALNSTANLTLFLPVDEAWEALPEIERKYLESEWALDDVRDIMQMHAVIADKIFWHKTFKDGLNLTSEYGSVINLTESKVASGDLVVPDIYASNGVLHLASSLLIPNDSLKITPEKYLLVLNCTSFVSLLHSVDLTYLINSTETEYTILAPNDDVLRLFGDSLPEKGSDQLKRLLSYHFIPGRWTPKKLKDGALLRTALKDDGLNGGNQVLEVEVSEQHLEFGGTGTVGDPLNIDNVTIYFISQHLTPPADVLETALPSLEFSTFLAAIFSTSLAEELKVAPSSTLLIPTNDAFKRLGLLVSAHLLASSSKPDLENVILHHVLRSVEYSKSIVNGSQQTFATLEGSDVHVHRQAANGSKIQPIINPSGGWPGMQSVIKPRNLLTSTGVIHELEDVLVPRSVEITVGKLVRAAKSSVMATIATKSGMEWVLNGTAPAEGEDGSGAGLEEGWTLLCPTDEAFKKYNLTALYLDVESMQAIIRQHLVPSAQAGANAIYRLAARSSSVPIEFEGDASKRNRPLILDDSATYTTLQSSASAFGDIVFRAAPPSIPGQIEPDYLVGIKNARGGDGSEDFARVLSWGRSTANSGSGGGGVIQIDRVLMPYYPPLWREYGPPIGVGIVGVALIGLFFLGMRALWRRDTTEATYEPIGGPAVEDDDTNG